MRPAFRDVSRSHQGSAHEAMANHERDCRSLLLGERQELRCEVAQNVTIKRHIVPDPEAVEDREQQQRVFGRLSERLRSLDIQSVPEQKKP